MVYLPKNVKDEKTQGNTSKLKGKTQNFEKKLNNSSKKLKVSANPLGLFAENQSKKNPGLKSPSDDHFGLT